MSRVTILTIGSRGDIEPCLALGKGLRDAGWRVSIATLTAFQADVLEHGFAFASLGDLPDRFRNHRGATFYGVVGRTLFWAVYQRLLASYLPSFLAACEGADLVIYSGLAFPAYHVAEALGIPCASLAFVPNAATGAFMNPLYADRRLSRGRITNQATFYIEQNLMVQSTAHLINRWRQRVLRLPAVPRRRLVAHRWERSTVVLLGVSEAVVARPADWDPRVHLTGYFFLDDARAGYEPDPALAAFLANGPVPIYVGFGSMTSEQGSPLAVTVIEALRQLGMRGVLARGWGGLEVGRGDVPPHIHVVDAVPHDWLFARVKLAVHHGGAGTTAAALRAGLPSVVVPFNYDQRYWGRLLAERGLGPEPIAPVDLQVEPLVRAVREIEDTPAYALRIRPIAAALSAENGVKAAVALLDRFKDPLVAST
ncbi:MAG: UDP:flavonoid glycosyltransferase YjiC, YdhE family [Cyanobacteria bacterium RYN_339]|nr:UDP:flavonoid glycosyltransferase YjiC, YdhE family [Cyanobacteria bacterium RYN_339]